MHLFIFFLFRDGIMLLMLLKFMNWCLWQIDLFLSSLFRSTECQNYGFAEIICAPIQKTAHNLYFHGKVKNTCINIANYIAFV